MSVENFYNILKKGWVVMKKHSSKALNKKIMLSLMVAGVMSSYAAGVAGAADSDKIITGPYIAPGPVDLEQIIVTNDAVELNYGGKVTHSATVENSDDRTVYISGTQGSLTAKDVAFTGDVKAANGASITLTGGTVLAGPGYGEVYATGKGSSIAATNTDFIGDVYAADGANVTLNGGSVTSVVGFQYYYNTALFAEGEGSTLTATDVNIKSRVFASDGGKVTIVDSNILKTDDSIEVDADSTVDISSTDGSHTYTVAYIAAEGGSVKVNSGEVQLEQVFVSYGGTVELLGGGYVDHLWTGEGTPLMLLVEGEGSSLYAKDVDFTGNVKAADGASITLNGGSVRTGPDYGDAYATGKGSSIAAANTDFVGNVYAADGANVTLNGGRVAAVVSYTSSDGSYYYNTALYATGEESTVTATDVNIKSGVFAANGGKVTIVDSNILKTDDNIQAESNGTVDISSTDGSHIYTVADITAIDGGSVTVNSGKVKLEQVLVSGGGSVELLGGGTVEHIATLENPDDRTVRVDGAGSSLTANDVTFTGDVKAVNGGSISLTGGSVIAGPYYEENEDTGILERSGGTEFTAVGTGSAITADSVDIQSAVFAQNGGKITIIDSDIDTLEGIWAENGTVTISSTDGANTYTAYEITAIGSGKIYLNGGTLQADNLREMTHGIEDEETGGYIDSAKGGIVLASDGKISTMTDQIFDTAAYDAAKDTVSDGTNVKVDNTAIDYQGGTLIFNDAQYTDAYLTNAKDALLAYNKDSKTSITMTGKRFDNAGEEVKDITVDEAVDKGYMEEQITVTADKNLLVGSATFTGKTHGIVIEDNVAKGFKAAVLNLGEGSDGMIITNNSEVTLGGGTITGDVLKVLQQDRTAETNKDLKVVVGTFTDIAGVTDKTAALNIGGGTATQDTSNQLTGSVTVNAGSTLNTTGQTTITGGVTLNGAELNVLAGQLNTSITVSGDATITGTVHAGHLTADEENGAVINIGNESKAGNVTVKEISLNGGTVFLDPVWDENGKGKISNASGLAVVDIDALDGNYIVGRNSLLSLGAERAEAEDVFKETGLTWGANNISAAAYIVGNIDVTKGSLVVNGNLPEQVTNIPGDGSVSFAANSLLMVNGEAIKVGASVDSATAAISGVQILTVDKTAKLYIDGAENKGVYKIIAGDDTSVWADANIITSNALIKFTGDTVKDEQFIVTAKLNDTRTVYGNKVVMPDVVYKALSDHATSSAAAFFNVAVSDRVNTTDAQQISALNNAAAMSELAGVSHATYSASNILTNAVADHMSLARSVDHDTDIWAHYVHTKENIDGLAAANSGAKYDAQYNGIVVGADLYKHGKGTIGAALTYIDGKVTGSTKNESEYYGLSIYGGVQNEDSAVIGDISYLHGKNEITQNNSGYVLTGEPKSDAFSVGVRAEQSFKAGAGKIVPYAGLRYMHLGTGNYTNSIGLSYDADDANLFLLPVGVKYSAEHKAAGWTLRPIVEVGYVWAMGDRDGQQTVSLNGTSNGFGYGVTDSGSYIGRFVLEAEKVNVTYGLGYEYQKGDSVKANKWMVNLNWNF